MAAQRYDDGTGASSLRDTALTPATYWADVTITPPEPDATLPPDFESTTYGASDADVLAVDTVSVADRFADPLAASADATAGSDATGALPSLQGFDVPPDVSDPVETTPVPPPPIRVRAQRLDWDDDDQTPAAERPNDYYDDDIAGSEVIEVVPVREGQGGVPQPYRPDSVRPTIEALRQRRIDLQQRQRARQIRAANRPAPARSVLHNQPPVLPTSTPAGTVARPLRLPRSTTPATYQTPGTVPVRQPAPRPGNRPAQRSRRRGLRPGQVVFLVIVLLYIIGRIASRS